MRYKLLCLVLFLEMLVVAAPILRATDLRGGVVGRAGPLVGVGVALFEVKPNNTLRRVRETVTAPDGKYHFNKVHPGQYVLRIRGINYPLEVRDTQLQDIQVIAPTVMAPRTVNNHWEIPPIREGYPWHSPPARHPPPPQAQPRRRLRSY